MKDRTEARKREWLKRCEKVKGGQCAQCANRHLPGKTRCEECQQKAIMVEKRRREELKAQGICVTCRKKPARENKVICQICADKTAERKYVKLYGITRAEKGTACAVCGNTTRLVTDHCHTSGVIRGTLCDRCNLVLGRVKDSPELLRKLADYLSE